MFALVCLLLPTSTHAMKFNVTAHTPASNVELYFDFARALSYFDAQHASELMDVYRIANPNATIEQLEEYLKYLILSDSIRINIVPRNINWAYLPEQVVQLGPNTAAVFNSNPISGLDALLIGHLVNLSTSSFWAPHTHHNGNGDAFRHAAWNARMLHSIRNESFVVRFATAWEHDGNLRGQPRIEYDMDMQNNHMGIIIGRRFVGQNPTNVVARIEIEVMNATQAGQLVRIQNGRLVPTDGTGRR